MFDGLFGLEKPHRISDGEDVELLTTVYDVVVLGMVRGLLEDAEIPYLVRERGTGSAMKLMTGFSLYGSDIFVPTKALETARDLIAGMENAEAVEILPDEDTAEGDTCSANESDGTEETDHE